MAVRILDSADVAEGADLLMVKPAMPYLDVIARAREQFDVPIAAYQVSGEFSMIMAAARNGWIDDAQLEALAKPLAKSGYGQYLLQLLQHKVYS